MSQQEAKGLDCSHSEDQIEVCSLRLGPKEIKTLMEEQQAKIAKLEDILQWMQMELELEKFKALMSSSDAMSGRS